MVRDNLGREWKNSVSEKAPEFAQYKAEMDEVFNILEGYESEASERFHEIEAKIIPEIIENCKIHNCPKFSLTVPFYVIDTKAYEEFKVWASRQSLYVRVWGRLGDEDSEDQNEVVLFITSTRE